MPVSFRLLIYHLINFIYIFFIFFEWQTTIIYLGVGFDQWDLAKYKFMKKVDLLKIEEEEREYKGYGDIEPFGKGPDQQQLYLI